MFQHQTSYVLGVFYAGSYSCKMEVHFFLFSAPSSQSLSTRALIYMKVSTTQQHHNKSVDDQLHHMVNINPNFRSCDSTHDRPVESGKQFEEWRFPHTRKIYHKKSYPAINPTRTELSHETKTVVITGGKCPHVDDWQTAARTQIYHDQSTAPICDTMH